MKCGTKMQCDRFRLDRPTSFEEADRKTLAQCNRRSAKQRINQNQPMKMKGNMNSQKANSHAGGNSSPYQPKNDERNMNSIPNSSLAWPGATWRRRRLPYTLAPLFLLALACVTFPRNSLAQSDDFNSGNDNGWTRHDPL